MADPENLVLEHLRTIRAMIEQVDRKVERLEVRLEHVEERIDGLDTRMTGLTHAVMAGFGAIVHPLDDHERRIARLEEERA